MLSQFKSLSAKSAAYVLISIVAVAGMLLFSLKSSAFSRSQTPKREIKVLKGDFPKDVIEIVEMRNLDSPDFPVDLEIEVKNISTKPIYGILIALYTKANGKSYVAHILYGRTELVDLEQEAIETDVPIPPGQKAVLKPEYGTAKGVNIIHKRGVISVEEFSKWILNFQTVSFGDRTGMAGSKAMDLRSKVRRATRPKMMQASFLPLQSSECNLGCDPLRIGPSFFKCGQGTTDSDRLCTRYEANCSPGSPCGKYVLAEMSCVQPNGDVVYCTERLRESCNSEDGI